MAVRLEVSHTYSYSFLTKLAKSLTQKCPDMSQNLPVVGFKHVELSSYKFAIRNLGLRFCS